MRFESPPSGISIHAPRTGSDGNADSLHPGDVEFQSTLPARGATGKEELYHRLKTISIHAPRTGSDAGCPPTMTTPSDFNPRSPHGERPELSLLRLQSRVFQSTLPARGATQPPNHLAQFAAISIHAPRTGSDPRGYQGVIRATISIHAPRTGSDDLVMAKRGLDGIISIHAPRTGSDRINPLHRVGVEISIHAPRTGSDGFWRFAYALR